MSLWRTPHPQRRAGIPLEGHPLPMEQPERDPPQPILPTEPAWGSAELDLPLQLLEKFGGAHLQAGMACLDAGRAGGNRLPEKEDANFVVWGPGLSSGK